METIASKWLIDDIKKALKFTHSVKLVKFILAISICLAYFVESVWLNEILIVSVLISLILPLGFFDVFIQKNLEYNTQLVEERQVLNAQEANKHFERIFQKIDDMENQVDY